jgi:hypothetical protein
MCSVHRRIPASVTAGARQDPLSLQNSGGFGRVANMPNGTPGKKPPAPWVHRLNNIQRRALGMLVSCQPRGCTESALMARGATFDVLADLVHNGLVAAYRDRVRAGDKTVKVVRLRITNAGIRALQGDALRPTRTDRLV